MTEQEKSERLRLWMDEQKIGDIPFAWPYWRPFLHIQQAKEVQAAMLYHGYYTGTDARPGGGWFAYFETELPEEGAGIARPTEAAAICEAAGLALGLWEEEGG